MSLQPSKTTVFILAAGRGERMMPLTANTPKPLLKVGECSLIENHINRLADMGFKDFVINIAYLGDAIKQVIGDGNRWGVRITFSDEQAQGALETAGGIQYALPLIKSDYFLCVNADIWTDFNFNELLTKLSQTSANNESNIAAAIVMVDNPNHNPDGDFCLSNISGNNLNNNTKNDNSHYKKTTFERIQHKNAKNPAFSNYTFSGIGIYAKDAFKSLPSGKKPLAPLLREWIDNNTLFGVVYTGQWFDIGTPERLAEINLALDKVQKA